VLALLSLFGGGGVVVCGALGPALSSSLPADVVRALLALSGLDCPAGGRYSRDWGVYNKTPLIRVRCNMCVFHRAQTNRN
jgi:hypothetical protein